MFFEGDMSDTFHHYHAFKMLSGKKMALQSLKNAAQICGL